MSGEEAATDDVEVDTEVETTEEESSGSADFGSNDPVETPEAQEPEGETPEGEKVEEVAQVAAAPKPISIALAAKAARMGIEDDELAQFTDADHLERTIAMIERRSAAKQDSAQSTVSDELQVDALFPDLPKDEEYSEGFKAMWTGAKDAFKKQHEFFQRQNQSNQQELQAIRIERETERFDSALGSLPEAEKLFGKGSAAEIDRKSEQYANRDKLWQARAKILRGSNGERISETELVKQAFRLAFGDQQVKAALSATASKIQKRRGQFTHAPTQRQPIGDRDPSAMAVKQVEKVLERKGLKRP